MTVDPAAVFTVRRGTVTAFDERVGAGELTEESGAAWSFHCTSIADGSRTIDVGVEVAFTVAPGPLGLEALAVGPPDA